MKKYLSIIAITLFFTSCLPEDPDITLQTEEDIINYINENDLNAIKSTTGLYYVIENEGSGERPTFFSTVTVAYKGELLDGTVFDQSDENGATFNLQQVIRGWTEGITYFKEGGNGKLIVPYQLGYGLQGRGALIPGGAVLVFDINLINVE